VFHSPYYAPVNFVDTRWLQPAPYDLFYRETFHTPNLWYRGADVDMLSREEAATIAGSAVKFALETNLITKEEADKIRSDVEAYFKEELVKIRSNEQLNEDSQNKFRQALYSIGEKYIGVGVPPNEPNDVCDDVVSILADFVARMKDKGVRVIVAHTPYLIRGAPENGWQEAEAEFLEDIASTGATILDRREELFLPRAYFFDRILHLNQVGRRERTKFLISDLKALGIGTAQDRLDRGSGQIH